MFRLGGSLITEVERSSSEGKVHISYCKAMDPNEIRKTKKKRQPPKPQESGLDTRNSGSEQRSESGGNTLLSFDINEHHGTLHKSSGSADSGACSDNAWGTHPVNRRDDRSLGHNHDAGCDADDLGLRSSDTVREELDHVEADLHNGGDVSFRTGLGTRPILKTKDQQRGAANLRSDEYRKQLFESGISYRLPSSPLGVDEVCMDAMKVIGSISAIVECMDAIDYADMDEFLLDYKERSDTFIKNCYIYLTSPECLGDKGGEEGTPPR